jgi:hypothetical protein
MGRGRFTALGLLALSLAAGTKVDAQSSNPNLQSVTEREKLQTKDLGIKLGSFLLLPQIDLSISHGDNIYATDHDKRGDFYLDTRAQVAVKSQFSRHALDASAYYDRNTYFKLTSENTSQYGAKADGRYDLSADGFVTVAGGYDRVAESRTNIDSITAASKPVLYDLYHGDASFSDTFGPLNAVLSFHDRNYRYHDAVFGSTTVDQSYRDFTVLQGEADLAYDLHHMTSFIVHGTVERRRYDLGFGDAGFDPAILTDRSANGVRIEAGLQHQVTSLVQATIRLGWLHYSYEDPRLNSLSAFSYHGELIWNVTPLTTIQASADRRVDETVSITYAGNLRDEFRIGAQHELLRNLILNVDGRYAAIRPSAVNETAAVGQLLSRSHELELGGGGHYYIGRNIRVNANFTHTQRRSNDDSLAFSENVGTVGISFFR